MARTAKDTTKVKLENGTELEITPVIKFDIFKSLGVEEDKVSKRLLKIIQSGIKPRIANEAKKAFAQVEESITANKNWLSGMETTFGNIMIETKIVEDGQEKTIKVFPPDIQKCVDAYKVGKLFDYPTEIEVTEKMVFDAIDAGKDEEEKAEDKPEDKPADKPTEKANGKNKKK